MKIGNYPYVSLKAAREARDEIKGWLAEGLDPRLEKGRRDDRILQAQLDTFEAVAEEFIDKKEAECEPGTIVKYRWCLDACEKSFLRTAVTQISGRDAVLICQGIERQGSHDKAKRTHAFIRAVLNFAVTTGRLQTNPVQSGKYLKRVETKHRPAITDPTKFGRLLRDIRKFEGALVVKLALQLSAHVFLRPGELRTSLWGHVDLGSRLWSVPAELMKENRPHKIPLSDQVIDLLKELRTIERDGLMFPSPIPTKGCISEGAMNQALKRMGYQGHHCPHGFRTTASTMLNEQGFNRDWIERQLAHEDTNQIRAVYNDAQYFEDRVKMMWWWSEELLRLESDTS